METFSIRDAVRYGWETFKKRPWFLIGVTLLLAAIDFLIPDPNKDASIPMIVGISLISLVLGSFLQLAGTNFALKTHDNVAEVRLADLWKPGLFLRFFGANLLVIVILVAAFLIPIAIAAGLYFLVGWIGLLALLLLVPSIILSIALSLTGYVVIDKHLGPIASIKESVRLTKGNRGKLFLLSLTFVLIALLGLVCLVVGLLVALPVIFIAMAHVYRVIDAEKSSVVSI